MKSPMVEDELFSWESDHSGTKVWLEGNMNINMDLIAVKIENYLYNRDNNFFWVNHIGVHNAERKFALSSDEKKAFYRRVLLTALVQSCLPDDIQCGITMLEDSLLHARTPKRKRKVMYLLAFGYYRLGNYSKSIDLLAACLEIKPKWCKPIILWKLINRRDKKERGNNLLIASATIVGLVTGLIGSTTIFLYPTWFIEASTFEFLTKDYKKVVTPSLPETGNPFQANEDMYLLAHRYYIRGNSRDLSRSSYLVDRCLEIAPEWEPAITLKRRIKSASVKAYIGGKVLDGIVIAAGVFGSMTLLLNW